MCMVVGRRCLALRTFFGSVLSVGLVGRRRLGLGLRPRGLAAPKAQKRATNAGAKRETVRNGKLST